MKRAHGSLLGFTLVEVLISTAMAMLMASLAISAFLKTRQLINTAESRVAMHLAAQNIYSNLRDSISCAQQSCAIVAKTVQSTGGANDPGSVTLIFMRAKDSAEDYAAFRIPNAHLQWEQWSWSAGTQTIYAATNRPPRRNVNDQAIRDFTLATSFIPTPGVNYNGQRFINLPQPRRTLTTVSSTGGALDPTGPIDFAHPEYSLLDDNIYFPNPANPRASLVSPEDVGDYSDLQIAKIPVLANVSDFSLELVPHDSSLATTVLDDSSTQTTVWQGDWLDGRLAPTLAPPQVFAGSDASKRPRLLRLRFTLTDTTCVLSQTFSFSFAWPGLSSEP